MSSIGPITHPYACALVGGVAAVSGAVCAGAVDLVPGRAAVGDGVRAGRDALGEVVDSTVVRAVGEGQAACHVLPAIRVEILMSKLSTKTHKEKRLCKRCLKHFC